ncbi:MAG: BtpA/SgcQ family protein [Acidobacteria bacterium]|nr:BtpA/SgcQ family protein [Acidobacteriota bacterium]
MKNHFFPNAKPIIGVIHVGALPGTPAHHQSISELIKTAAREAKLYSECGVDGIIIENMHDVPYLRGAVGAEIVAAMTVIGQAVKHQSQLPTGIQILAAANLEALAVAHAAQLDFVRVEGYVFAHVADEGLIESSAAKLLRYRKMIGAERIKIWADIKKKHSAHALTADISLAATAEAVEFMRGDVVIVTGKVTGEAPQSKDVQEAKTHCHLPIILGSGIDAKNLKEFYTIADGFIIGTAFKKDGQWQNGVDHQRVKRLMKSAEQLRG